MTKINVAVCLLLSALVLAKARVKYDNADNEYSYETVDVLNESVSSEDQAGTVRENEPRFKPNEKLQRAEAELTEAARERVEQGEVRATLEDAVDKELREPKVAQLREETGKAWKAALSGPEAARVMGAIGEAAQRVMTSPTGSQSVAMLTTVARVLLDKLGEVNEKHAAAGTLDAATRVLTSAQLPEAIQQGSEAIINMASNPQVAQWEKALIEETKKLLLEPNFVKRLDNYLSNVESMLTASQTNAKRANSLKH